MVGDSHRGSCRGAGSPARCGAPATSSAPMPGPRGRRRGSARWHDPRRRHRDAARLVVLGRPPAPVLRARRVRGAHSEPRTDGRRFGDDDLVIVESRNCVRPSRPGPAARLHLRPKRARSGLAAAGRCRASAAFSMAPGRTYRDVYFLGGGGTDLLSARVAVEPVCERPVPDSRVRHPGQRLSARCPAQGVRLRSLSLRAARPGRRA